MGPDNSFILFSQNSKKISRDHITPHKISLLVLIKEFCNVKQKVKAKNVTEITYDCVELTSQQKRDFGITILKLIQRLDLSLSELISAVKPILNPDLHSIFMEKLEDLESCGIYSLMDYIQSLDTLLVDPFLTSPVIFKSSILGLFVRRMLLAFDKLTFGEVMDLYKSFVKYCQPYLSNKDHDENSMGSWSDEEAAAPGQASQKQAEFFIAEQVALLQINENEALSPPDLHQKLSDLLKANPDLGEAHYLSYANCLRSKEWCGAVSSLLHHFDCTHHSKPSSTTAASHSVDDTARYAALNMAILQAQFGHREEALLALREAIELAQDANDNACLQHALTRLHQLTTDSRGPLVERSVAKSSDLSMWYLSSLNLLALAQHQALSKVQPSQVIEILTKSDICNCRHAMSELIGTSYAQRAALWSLYGNKSLSNLVHQCLLHLNTSVRVQGRTYHRSSAVNLALYALIWDLIDVGQTKDASEILRHAKKSYPQHKSMWELSNLQMQYQESLNRGEWEPAMQAAQAMAALSQFDYLYRKAEVSFYMGYHVQADSLMEKLLETTKNQPLFHVRATLLECRRVWHVGYPKNSLALLQVCLQTCIEHHFYLYECLTILHLAAGLCYHGHAELALPLLDKVMVQLYAHGSALHHGQACYLYARCLLDTGSTDLPAIYKWLKKAQENFDQIQDLVRLQGVVVHLAKVCHQLQQKEERNFWAHKQKLLQSTRSYPIPYVFF